MSDEPTELDPTPAHPVGYLQQEYPAPIFPGAEPIEAEQLDDATIAGAASQIRSQSGRRQIVVAVVLVIGIMLAVGAFWSFTTGTEGATTAEDGEAAHLSETEMADFLREHYAQLPGGIDQTWKNLSSVVQQQVGGYGEYIKLWSTVRSVQFATPRSRDARSVSYSLTVQFKNGDIGTEERWAEIRKHEGNYILNGITTVSRDIDECKCVPPDRPENGPTQSSS